MDDSKDPPENSYGARLVTKSIQEDGTKLEVVELDSVLSLDKRYNGHMSRNLRAYLALIDNAKPYIHITGIEEL